ncbi:MAG TPA: long-chain N-acyl amino acid synthase [Burkholderiaceae bacterium]|nr:long-chain N-acyl amino acid synthase [Burkholderiaceae bacterium]
MTAAALKAPGNDLLAPDTIVNVSGEDGDLHAEMPTYLRPAPWRPSTGMDLPSAQAQGTIAAGLAPVGEATIGLPLPALPQRKAEDLVLNRPEEPTLLGLPTQRTVANAPVRFKIRLANEEGARSDASYLIHKMYSWRGYAASGPKAAPNRVTLVASDAERALATISIGFDSPDGLVVDDLYKTEVDALRDEGAVICEFTKLAVDRDQQSKELLAMMFHIAYMYARRMQQCTDLLIEVNPRHVRFYQRMLGFRQLGPERSCPRVGGAPAVLLWLRLRHAHEQIEIYGGHKDKYAEARSLYPFFFAPGEEDGIVGRLKAIG